jgi:MFS family permease
LSRQGAGRTLPLFPRPDCLVNPPRTLVPALSLTLLVSWGSLYYAFAVLVRPMQLELQWGATWTMGAYSTALVAWGLCAYPVGRIVQRYGGRAAMTLGSCLCGVLLALLSGTHSPWVFYLVWAGLGAGMALTLYDPAFAVLVDAYPGAYRRRLGVLTLVGGLASTAFWPLTHLLVSAFGWRDTVLVYAAMHLLVCAPLHWLVLPAPRPRNEPDSPAASGPATRAAMQRPAFWLLAFAFAAFGFVTSAVATHVVPMLESTGAAPAMAIAIAALIGPMQVAGRSTDLLLAGRLHPLATGAVTVVLIPIALAALWTAPFAAALLYAFAALYGAGLGLLTIVRATTPVEVFGSASYATVSGALSAPSMLARAAGPLAGTYLFAVYHRYDAVLVVLIACAAGGAAAYLFVTRSRIGGRERRA